ncbi:MAG TPA: PEP-CTERM sorting domain-containing protein [Methylophilaceae bacterium]|nr:PEP-CTERM sorting domain-containing protein [Methylophilaceae bacterium]
MTLLNRLCVGVFCLLSLASTSSWAQIIHWEIDAEIVDPGTYPSQERSFSGGFDFDTLTGSIFNITIVSTSTTGQPCFLCFDYAGSTGEVYNDGSGGLGAEFRERVDSAPPAYRTNYLGIFGFDITQPGIFSNVNLEEQAYFNAGTGDPVDDTFISDTCVPAGCATLTGTLVPIPEPETYAMLLAGLGILGWRSRKQNRMV